MILRRRSFAKPNNRRGYKGVGKLHVVRVETVNAQECHAIEKIPLDGLAVVYVHEFAWDEPSGNAALGHPCVGQGEEMTVQARETADLHPAGLLRTDLQAVLVTVFQVMVPHVGR